MPLSTHEQLREIESYLHEQIPITLAMEVSLAAYDGASLTLSAPLSVNHNHLGTAFGGSLSAIATLAGYCMLWLQLPDRTAHVVVRESTLSFKRPVRGDIRATCCLPEMGKMGAFLSDFERRGKARIRLEATIEDRGLPAVEFQGLFVAMR